MKHIMVDLETLGTTPNSVILSIGAVAFDFNKSDCSIFQIRIDRTSCETLGLDVDPDTVKWWEEQDPRAREAAFGGWREDVWTATSRFSDWFKDVKGEYIWGNGSDFDVALLKGAFNLTGVATPWNYRGVRCFRTLMAEFGADSDWVKPVVAHNAAHDAMAQVQTLVNLYKRKGWTRGD